MNKQLDMTHGPLAGKLLLFALPLMFSNVLQLLFNAADVVVVGRFAGDNSLAAVGSTASLIALITGLFIGLSVGVNVVAAMEIGKGHADRMYAVVHTAITLSLISGLILVVLGVAITEPILRLMGTPEEVLPLATKYLRIYFLGMPFLMAYNFGSALLRAQGDTKRPMYYLFFSGVVNVILNCILVIFFKLDVAGVAIATVFSQMISATLVLRCLSRDEGMLHLDIGKFFVDKIILHKIVKIGIPAGIQGVVFSISNVMIQSAVNSFGATVVAGDAACLSLTNFIYMALNAFYQTNLSFIGQNTGAGKYDRVDKITLLVLLYVFIIGTTMSVLMYIFGPTLLGIYSSSADVIAMGMIRMKYYTLIFVLCNIMDVLPGCIRGMGYSVLPMIVSLLGSCAFRIIWIMTYFASHHTMKVLYISYPISWVITITAHVVCYMILRKKIRVRKRAVTA